MICTKCGALMDQTDKDTSSGRVIREYLCRSCGHTDWEDDGVALWKVLHDAREEDEAERAAQAATNTEPEAGRPCQNPRTSLWKRLTHLFRKEN
jgi:DNA-directed RNA polymerase subunit M/transcription elongation factor TFIIS